MDFDINDNKRFEEVKKTIEIALKNPWDSAKIKKMKQCEESQYEIGEHSFGKWVFYDYGKFKGTL